MAEDFKSSHRTIKRILNIDLNKDCYRKITVRSLKEDQKPIRKICYQWIRKSIDRSKLERMMFTDKKIFIKNDHFNSKYDVIWADDRSNANEPGGLHPTEKYPMCHGIRLSGKLVQLVSKRISETFDFCHSIEGAFLLRYTKFWSDGFISFVHEKKTF